MMPLMSDERLPAAALSRRGFVAASAVAAMAVAASQKTAAAEAATCPYPHPVLTAAEDFEDVSRGNPKPFTLKGEALVAASLTPETWRLEVDADPAVDEVVKQPAKVTKALTE